MRICVFGSYKDPGGGVMDEAARLGGLLAGRGAAVVTGGFGGIMEEVSKGAKDAGGSTAGVTYYEYGDTKGRSANPYVDEEVRTDNVFRRIEKMLECDGFVVMPGGTGTLLELASVLECINKGLMPPKPVVALGGYWRGVLEGLREEPVLNESVKRTLKASNCSELVSFVENADEAVGVLFETLKPKADT